MLTQGEEIDLRKWCVQAIVELYAVAKEKPKLYKVISDAKELEGYVAGTDRPHLVKGKK